MRSDLGCMGNMTVMAHPAPLAPDLLGKYLDGRAEGRLRKYFDHSGTFTGGRFERFAGGGDRPETADTFTGEDIVAVSLLSIRIPGRVALQVLDNRAFEGLLGEIPVDVDLWEADERDVAAGSPADDLWHRLESIDGIGWVTAGKLLARKRPRLIPVYDDVVRKALGRKEKDGWWLPLHAVLSENPNLIKSLQELRSQAELDDDVSLLRILDVCIWMAEHGKPEPVPDSET